MTKKKMLLFVVILAVLAIKLVGCGHGAPGPTSLPTSFGAGF